MSENRPLALVTGASHGITEAVNDELRGTGVSLTSLMPGPTATDFFRRAGSLSESIMGRMPKDDPAEVARQG